LHTAGTLEGWLRGARGSEPAAIVLGGSFSGLSFARSLGRRRIPVLLLASGRFLGTYSRYAHVMRLPPVEHSPERWIGLLGQIGSRLPVPGALFPMGDAHTLLVARNRTALKRHFRFLVPDTETVEKLVDKRSQYPLARAAGVPIPAVHFPASSEEARRLSGSLPYPCLLKPYVSHAARSELGGKLLVVGSPAELMSAYERISAAGVELMLQEIVPGEDTALLGYLAFWDGDGRELAWLTKRKLRQYPPQFGDGALQVTVEAPEVAELSRRLLRAFDYRGFVGVEFKRSALDDIYRLMEINPRVVSGNELAVAAGVDFPWIGYRHLTDSDWRGGPPNRFRHGVKYVNEEWDVQAYLALRKSGKLGLRTWLASLRGVRARAIWALDDPMPFLIGLGRLARLAFSRAWSKPT
jgi:predicted ATP-grasp superfamily ATP-dependent carboligase